MGVLMTGKNNKAREKIIEYYRQRDGRFVYTGACGRTRHVTKDKEKNHQLQMQIPMQIPMQMPMQIPM